MPVRVFYSRFIGGGTKVRVFIYLSYGSLALNAQYQLPALTFHFFTVLAFIFLLLAFARSLCFSSYLSFLSSVIGFLSFYLVLFFFFSFTLPLSISRLHFQPPTFLSLFCRYSLCLYSVSIFVPPSSLFYRFIFLLLSSFPSLFVLFSSRLFFSFINFNKLFW